MIFKKNTDRIMMITSDVVNLDDLYVTRMLDGNKKPSGVPMTVRDFIEHLSSYGLDGTIEVGFEHTSLLIVTTREENNEEYETRMALLKRLDQTYKEARKKKNQETQDYEIQLLRKLTEKYKGKI